MNAQDKAEARAAIERAGNVDNTCCPDCDGDGLKIIAWNEEDAYENIEGFCDNCKGTGSLKNGSEGLIPELAAHLKAALDALEACQEENNRLKKTQVKNAGRGHINLSNVE